MREFVQMPRLGEVRVVSAILERSKARAVAAIPDGKGIQMRVLTAIEMNSPRLKCCKQIYANANPFQRMRALTLMTRLRPECEP